MTPSILIKISDTFAASIKDSLAKHTEAKKSTVPIYLFGYVKKMNRCM
jgi:hypothetical protein